MHCRLRGAPSPTSSSQMSLKPQMPLQTIADFWCNTEKSEAAMSLLWSADVLVILDREIWIIQQWNSILNESFLNVVFNDVSKGPFTSQVYWWQVYLQKNLVPIFILCGVWVLLARFQTSTLFICSLRLGVDTEKPSSQTAALKKVNLRFRFDLILYQCFAWGSRVLYRKALVSLSWLLLMAVLQSLWTVNYF